jgi:D-alanyl-D-alanine carboxypeptidase
MRAWKLVSVKLPSAKLVSVLARKLLAVVAAVAVALSPSAAGPALLFDLASGRVLYAEDQDDQWFPASLTKIITAYLVFEALRDGKLTLQQKVRMSELAHSQPPSRIGLPVGAEITVETAIQAVIIKSANDASVMLAEAVAGTQEAFAEQMNLVAKRLGMTRSNFVNANGLPAAEQVTTARDLAKLTVAVVRDFPQFVHLWGMGEMRLGKRLMRNHNALLRTYDGADGMKTGFICDAGYNLVASASRDGMKIVAVVLGETTGKERSTRAANLLEHGFQTLAWKSMFGTETLDTLPMAPDPKGAASIRKSVISWVCGNRPARKARAKSKRRTTGSKTKAASKAKTKKAKASDD